MSFKYLKSSLSEGFWATGFENATVAPVTSSCNGSENWEFETVFSEEVRARPADIVLFVKNSGSDDGDGVSMGSVVSGHFHVELADGSVERNISVLLVHVVDACPGLVPEDNTESLDVIGSAFVDFVDGEDLTLSAFGFKLSSEMIPKLGFGDNIIACKKPDSINLW